MSFMVKPLTNYRQRLAFFCRSWWRHFQTENESSGMASVKSPDSQKNELDLQDKKNREASEHDKEMLNKEKSKRQVHTAVQQREHRVLLNIVSSSNSDQAACDDLDVNDKREAAKKKLMSLLFDAAKTGELSAESPTPKLQLSKPLLRFGMKSVADGKADERHRFMSQDLPAAIEAKIFTEDMVQEHSELAKKLCSLNHLKQQENIIENGVINILEGMVIEKQELHESRKVTSSAFRHARIQDQRELVSQLKHDIFSSQGFEIFKQDTMGKEGRASAEQTKESKWEDLQQREMRTCVLFAPSNAFEEIFHWTEQRKYWKFPIDNEIDIGPEEHTGFHEHVFLDRHLEGFPKKGPIRHFMELVVTGLSTNPYISVERKIRTINWFHQYFKEKASILSEHGILDEK